MANYTYEIDTTKNYPNIIIEKILKDGVHNGYRMTPAEGYVMYDTAANEMEWQEDDNGEWVEVPVISYSTIAYLPLTYFNNPFTWVAVLRSEVPEDRIFGNGNNHETI